MKRTMEIVEVLAWDVPKVEGRMPLSARLAWFKNQIREDLEAGIIIPLDKLDQEEPLLIAYKAGMQYLQDGEFPAWQEAYENQLLDDETPLADERNPSPAPSAASPHGRGNI